MHIRNWIGRAAVAAVLILLAGCATVPKLELKRSVAPEAALESGEGALIIGLKKNTFLTAWGGVRRLEFWRVDPATHKTLDPKQAKVVGLSRGSWFTGQDVVGDAELLVQKMPAGTYVLVFVSWEDRSGAVGKRTISFTVRPGASTYVGVYEIDIPMLVFFDIEVAARARDAAGARAMLARFPNLPQSMSDQPPQWVRIVCDKRTEVGKVCYPPE